MSTTMLKTIITVALLISGINSDPLRLARPCRFNDHKCLRDNISANSRCNPKVPGSLPREYRVKAFKFDTPFFNATYVDNDLVISNHQLCEVSEFFFNVATDSALLSLDCPGLTFRSNRTLIQHNPKKQDSFYSYEISTYYPFIQLTVDIKNANKIDLCSSFAYAYVTELPILNITPNNKPTADALDRDLSFMSIFAREEIYGRANQLLKTYINNCICDFGCNA